MALLDLGYFIFLLLAFPIWIRFLFRKNYRQLLRHRFTPDIEPDEKPNLWIHAVSVGEVKSLSLLVGRLEEGRRRIVLSVTTPSGYRYACKAFPGIRVINAPLDFSFVIRHFVNRINPSLLILNELEIWPNWLRVLHRRKIPVMLINGRVSEPAFRRYRRFRFLFGRFFRLIDFYYLQAEIHRRRFAALGIPESRMHVCGNIKADEAAALTDSLPPRADILNAMKTGPARKMVLTFASTHAADDDLVLPACPALRDRFAMVIVPRHPERSRRIRHRLENLGVDCALWSEAGRVNLDETVLILDKIGLLFQVLAVSDIVYMGGTTDARIGGHNLYEPAVLGRLILGGPHVNNFPVIGRELIRKNVYRVVRNRDELENLLLELGDRDLEAANPAARESVLQEKGSTACILAHIRELDRS